MKKLLLACFLALGIGATAQIDVTETFEVSPVPDFTITGGYQPNHYYSVGCGGDNGGYGSRILAFNASDNTVNIIYTKPNTSTANGKKIDVSFDYNTVAYTSSAGTVIVAYSKSNTGTTFTNIGTLTIPADNPDSVCSTFTGTIPESANVNGEFRLRIQVVTATADDVFYFFVDNVKITQETFTPPSCTTVTLPADGTNPNNSNSINWLAAAGATAYKVYVGTSAGTYDIANGTSISTLTYPLTGLAANTSSFVKVVPTNANGDAADCTEGSFISGPNTYCDDITSSAPDHANYEKIGNVTFSDINNTSTATTAYEDFTSIVGTVKKGEDYAIAVTVSTFDNDYTSVWIDYNQDNVFSNSERTFLTSTAIATGTISIPTDALLGNTRMRVRTSYEASPTPCGAATYGQAEDYTLDIKDAGLAASSIDKSRVSVYPNPFTDVLKISEIKGVQSVSVADVSGRQVKSLAPSAELNLSSLKAGLYIVTLKMEDGSVKTFKTIKK